MPFAAMGEALGSLGEFVGLGGDGLSTIEATPQIFGTGVENAGAGGLGGFLGDIGTGDLLKLGGTIGSTLLNTSANRDAASTTAQAERDAAAARNQALDKQIGALRQGIAEGDQYYNGIREQTQPGVSYLRGVIGAPADLTPEQKLGLQDLTRRVTNSSQVAGSALRGSGRSFVDSMRQIEEGYIAHALDQNRARADQAATQFATPNFNTQSNQAAAHATLGQQVGGVVATQGANTGNAITNTGYGNANADLANAGIYSSGLGDLASIIRGEEKARATKNPAQPSSGGRAMDERIPAGGFNPDDALGRMG